MIRQIFTFGAFFVEAVVILVQPAVAEPIPTKSRAVDARAVATFDLAIKALKKYRSMGFAADETLLDTVPPQQHFISASLQWPYRAKVRETGESVLMQGVVGSKESLLWDGAKIAKKAIKTPT